jgi:hypothetical protein
LGNFGKWKPKFLKIQFSFTEVLRGKIRGKIGFLEGEKRHGGGERNLPRVPHCGTRLLGLFQL